MRDISLRSPIDFDVKLQLAEANIAIKWKEKMVDAITNSTFN